MRGACTFIRRYLLRCILEDPKGGRAFSRHEGAGILEEWFDNLAEMEGTGDILLGVVTAVTDLFLSGDDQVRRAIETGFLEHVFDQRKLRHLFSDWAYDERLQDAWQHALAWGDTHPNFMKSLRATIRAAEPEEE
jgi:hypothetical protein